jgi:NAD(P)-dependent dehydrogenase (short-subunit alcohol dehydrogenase family)
VEQELGACRVLVNNAAIQPVPADLMTLTLDAWNQLLAVNLTGALVCAQAFGAQMIAAGGGGCILNVASIGGDYAWPRSSAYGVSKAGMMMLTRMLALELAPHGIRSNTIKPALVHTPASEYLYADPEVVRKREQVIPSGRISVPGDLADVITFLASDRASYINGQDILVDGGVSQILMGLVPKPASAPKI